MTDKGVLICLRNSIACHKICCYHAAPCGIRSYITYLGGISHSLDLYTSVDMIMAQYNLGGIAAKTLSTILLCVPRHCIVLWQCA